MHSAEAQRRARTNVRRLEGGGALTPAASACHPTSDKGPSRKYQDMSRKLAVYQPPRLGLPRRLPAEAMARVRGYQRASKADATMRAYRADAAAFDAWCRQHELQQRKRYYLLAVQLLLIA